MPRLILQERRSLASIILQGIEHAPARNDYEILCGGCGLELLRQLYKEATTIGLAETNNIHAAMSHTFQSGV